MGNPVASNVILHHLRVPLLIVHLQNGRSIDIQFPDEQFQAIRNTNLIRHYVQCDNRLSKLFLYLRMLFDALEIRNSKYGLLSSYHILLLAIHFLQCEQALIPWTVLPVLCKTHSDLVSSHIPIDDVVATLDAPQQAIGECLTPLLSVFYEIYYQNCLVSISERYLMLP
ncbi:hypothetical protein GCK32_018127 [Trichostrongylus colubriformis]|uniref:Uncharacterized protein n=2 Tax=Trichostrongylus colubriformis TaxID=6319 RepID=A0AAN8FRI6_TRICO